MAHLLRLIRVLLALGVLLGASMAHASFPPIEGYRVDRTTIIWNVLVDGCKASLALLNVEDAGNYVTSHKGIDQVNKACLGVVVNSAGTTINNNYPYANWSLAGNKTCPQFATLGSNVCTCQAGYPEGPDSNNAWGMSCGGSLDERTAAGFCNSFSQSKKPFKQTGTSTGSTPASTCYMPYPPFEGADAAKGCVSTLGDSVATPNANGTRSWSATGTLTGAVCTDAPATGNGSATQNPPPRSAENPCPSGFPGTVNGATVCVPSVPDSGIEGVKTTESTTSAGVKTVTTEATSCSAGVCTSTTTTKTYNAAGTLTGTTVGATVKQPITVKCASDPGNKVCGEVGLGTGKGSSGSGNGSGGESGPSSFAGNCANGFKAQSDDAVVNAMAEETFRQNCKVNPDEDSQTLAKAEAVKTGDQTLDNPNNSAVSVAPGNFDTTDVLGGSCIADKTVQVAGQSVTLPLSNVCQYLEALGAVLLACSFLLAARIVTRG